MKLYLSILKMSNIKEICFTSRIVKQLIPLVFVWNAHNSFAAPVPSLNPSPSVPITIGECPDYSGALNLPEFNWPEKTDFDRWVSRYWSQNYSPYHMVHDVIVNPNEPIRMVGKFDYSSTVHNDLEDEYVRAYLYGTGMSDWEYLGRFKTDGDGKVNVPVDAVSSSGEFVVRMVVEGDLSSADGFISVTTELQDTIIFDIDGTITLSDFEQVGDYFGVSVAQSWPYAQETVQAYIDKGYRIIFLTGRPYWIARDTREWFTNEIDLPQWHLHTNDDGGSPLSLDAETYKREYIAYLQDELQLNIVRAYGNADTDIAAYIDAGISEEDIWIIGENAGVSGTQDVGDNYIKHYDDIVIPTEDAMCRF